MNNAPHGAVLSDATLKERLQSGSLIVRPTPGLSQIQAASIDLHLGTQFRRWKRPLPDFLPLDANPEDYMETFHVPEGESLCLRPGEFLLAHTREWVGIPDDLVAQVNGKSSIGRRGLLIHVTAGWVDPGFGHPLAPGGKPAQVTLEMAIEGEMPLELRPGMLICQLILLQMDRPVEQPYQGRYQGQEGATASRLRLPFCPHCRGAQRVQPYAGAPGLLRCPGCGSAFDPDDTACPICEALHRSDGTCLCRGHNVPGGNRG